MVKLVKVAERTELANESGKVVSAGLTYTVQRVAGFLLTASPGFFLVFLGYGYMGAVLSIFSVLLVACVLLIVGTHPKGHDWEPAKAGFRFGLVVLFVTFVCILFSSFAGIAAEP
jgi:heme O synthase-like polyprenyltransferase